MTPRAPLPPPAPDPSPAPDPPGAEPGPLLTQRALLVLVAAAFIGTVVGVLTFLSAGDVAGALLAGLTGFGTATFGLHRLIGR